MTNLGIRQISKTIPYLSKTLIYKLKKLVLSFAQNARVKKRFKRLYLAQSF